MIFCLHDELSASYILSIAEPLDGAFNNKIATFKQTITDSSNVEFIYKKRYPAVISVEVTGRKFYVIMSPNTTAYVDIYPQISTNDWIVFRGDNAAGHELYNAKPFNDWTTEVQDIFRNNEMNYKAININIENYVKAALYPIDSLKAHKKISGLFAKSLKKEFLSIIYTRVVNHFNYLFYAARNDHFTVEDSMAIRSSQDKIFSIFPPLNPDILTSMWGSFYLTNYIDMTYHNTDIRSDKRYISLFNNDWYGRYGFLPEKLLEPMLGNLIVSEFFYTVNEFDKIKAADYFKKRYPDSEYVPIIDSVAKKYKQIQPNLLQEETQNNKITMPENLESNKKISNIPLSEGEIYIDTSVVISHINTLKELHETCFKGKKIFIDIWAPWCEPCIKEFANKKQLDSLLHVHDITPVLLSLGPKMFMKQWVQLIYDNKLAGYHFLINNALNSDIIHCIANHSDSLPVMPNAMPNVMPDAISIPHYIYMDEKGNIIEKDAPRPSEIVKLAALFSKKQ